MILVFNISEMLKTDVFVVDVFDFSSRFYLASNYFQLSTAIFEIISRDLEIDSNHFQKDFFLFCLFDGKMRHENNLVCRMFSTNYTRSLEFLYTGNKSGFVLKMC